MEDLRTECSSEQVWDLFKKGPFKERRYFGGILNVKKRREDMYEQVALR